MSVHSKLSYIEGALEVIHCRIQRCCPLLPNYPSPSTESLPHTAVLPPAAQLPVAQYRVIHWSKFWRDF